MLGLAGFVVGYLVGVQEGREGYQRMVAAAQELMASEEARAMLGAAVTAVSGMVSQALAQSGVGSGGDLATALRDRFTGRPELRVA